MKKSALCLLLSAVLTSACAQQTDDDTLYRDLTTGGKGAVPALKEVLDRSESVNSLILFMSCAVALREHRIEDAGFLLYVARFRAEYDKSIYAPVGTGGNSPMVLIGALSQQLGSAVNPQLMASRSAFSHAVDRVKKWQPKSSADYKPGWESSKKGNALEAEQLLDARRKEFLKGMGGISTLLQDDAYFAAFQIAQDFNLKAGDQKPTQKEFDDAMATMRRIEVAKGIEGIASMAGK